MAEQERVGHAYVLPGRRKPLKGVGQTAFCGHVRTEIGPSTVHGLCQDCIDLIGNVEWMQAHHGRDRWAFDPPYEHAPSGTMVSRLEGGPDAV